MKYLAIIALTVFMAVGAGAESAQARVKDGQACSTERGGPSDLRPDGCFYVSPYGGAIELPTAATEVDIWVDGKHLHQDGHVHMWRGKHPLIQTIRMNGTRRPPTVVNGYFRAIRVYWWAS